MMKKISFFIFGLFTLITLFTSPSTSWAQTTCDQCGIHISCSNPVCKNCPNCRAPTTFFGSVAPPQGIAQYGDFQTGVVKFTNVLLKLIIGAAGLFAFFNIIIAGYTFMSAGGDAKKVEQAWSRIWQSLLGLLFVAGSFVLAAIFGWLIFGDARAILVPTIYGP